MENIYQISNEVNGIFQSAARRFQTAPVLNNKVMHKTTWVRAGQVQPMAQEDSQKPKRKDDSRLPPGQNDTESMSSWSEESVELAQPRLLHTRSLRHQISIKKKHPSASPIPPPSMVRSHKTAASLHFLRKQKQRQHGGIRKAMTWLGQPLDKILKKEETETVAAATATTGSLDLEQSTYNANMSHLQPSRSIAQNTTKTLHCKILQITNFTSGREYQYHLEVQLDGVVIHSLAGSTKRITKGVSAASSQQTFTFSVDGPFELKLLLRGRPVIPTRVKDGVMRIKDLCSGPVDHPMPVIGSKQLLSGESVDQFAAAAQGISRYTLTPPLAQDQRSLDVEVMLMFRLDDLAKCPSMTAKTTTTTVSPLHKFVAASICHRSQDFQSCYQGGYLTFYVRGQGHPLWIRFWVKLKESACLELYNATYKESLVDTIPIANIQAVMEPSVDDQERVYMASSRGVVLEFDMTSTRAVAAAAAVDGLDGKMFFYADTSDQAFYWRKELNVYVAVGEGGQAKEKSEVNLRYIL